MSGPLTVLRDMYENGRSWSCKLRKAYVFWWSFFGKHSFQQGVRKYNVRAYGSENNSKLSSVLKSGFKRLKAGPANKGRLFRCFRFAKAHVFLQVMV